MNKNELMTNVTRTLNRTGLKLKKHSPEILVVTGVVGVVASAVMACKASTKVNDLLAEAKENIEAIHAVAEKPENAEKYTEEDTKKALAITYAKTGVELAKLYGPAVVLGTASIACILGGHNILRKRNAAMAVAYTAIDRGFKDYRKRVVDRFGEELDKELRYNLKAKEVEEVITNEDGSEVIEKKTVTVSDDTDLLNPNNYSMYARIYDDGCKGWDKDPEMSRWFLTQAQNTANEILKSRGHLFLNDVYEMLGFPKTKVGQVVGWVYDKDNPIGDNYVDFGFMDTHKEKARDFVNGYERVVVLDFNVDGAIWELIS